ncbi:MAG: hypothetical protein Q8M34_07145 [Thermodesulfovibrionales bacterium]|nr:hypothetical protein [Thermodesulfovibrionales bacterium]
MKNKIRIIFWNMLAAIALSACMPAMSVRTEFDDSINKYNKFLSSQSFDAAGFFASESIAQEFNSRVKAAKNIKVIDRRILRIQYDEENGTAQVEVEIDYYSLSSYRMKTLLDIQKWAYVTENGFKRWRLMSLLPEFL